MDFKLERFDFDTRGERYENPDGLYCRFEDAFDLLTKLATQLQDWKQSAEVKSYKITDLEKEIEDLKKDWYKFGEQQQHHISELEVESRLLNEKIKKLSAELTGRAKKLPCRIYEYDGSYKCFVHKKMWGAVTNPDIPCEGWQDEQRQS